METMFEIGLRELDRRSSDGVEVTLLWDARANRVFVDVDDERRDTSFRLVVDPGHALDAFHHPYAYAIGARRDGQPLAA